MHLSVEELLHYTDEERSRWEQWFRDNGEDLLSTPILGDMDRTVGALILHIFGPELRYVQRLKGEPLTEYRGLPSHHIDEVFGFGLETRKSMRDFVLKLRPDEWSRPVIISAGGREYRASVRKIIFHVLLHELRHWAQIARLVRERGLAPPGNHDLLMSTALL